MRGRLQGTDRWVRASSGRRRNRPGLSEPSPSRRSRFNWRISSARWASPSRSRAMLRRVSSAPNQVDARLGTRSRMSHPRTGCGRIVRDGAGIATARLLDPTARRSGRSRTPGCCWIRAGDRVVVQGVRRGRSLVVHSRGIQHSGRRHDEQISNFQAIRPGDPAPVELPEGLAIALGSIVEPGDAREAFPGSDGVLTDPGGYRPGAAVLPGLTAAPLRIPHVLEPVAGRVTSSSWVPAPIASATPSGPSGQHERALPRRAEWSRRG